jgi:hypothetical protein
MYTCVVVSVCSMYTSTDVGRSNLWGSVGSVSTFHRPAREERQEKKEGNRGRRKQDGHWPLATSGAVATGHYIITSCTTEKDKTYVT